MVFDYLWIGLCGNFILFHKNSIGLINLEQLLNLKYIHNYHNIEILCLQNSFFFGISYNICFHNPNNISFCFISYSLLPTKNQTHIPCPRSYTSKKAQQPPFTHDVPMDTTKPTPPPPTRAIEMRLRLICGFDTRSAIISLSAGGGCNVLPFSHKSP